MIARSHTTRWRPSRCTLRQVGQIVAAVVLLPWLAIAAALPPEHVHESGAADHHGAVAHRHFAPHEHAPSEAHHHSGADDHATAAAVHLDHDGAEIEDPDEPVVWIDEVGIVAAPRSFDAPLLIATAQVTAVPEPVVHMAAVADEATLPHGPPRPCLSLRAPPAVIL